MKKLLMVYAMILGAGVFVDAWSGEVRNADSTVQSECKYNDDYWWRPSENQNGESVRRYLADPESAKYRVEYHDGTLTVTWYDEIYSCGARIDNATIELVGDHQLVFNYEVEDDWSANCICPFDVTATVKGIEPGDYVISFGDKYLGYPLTINEGADIALKPYDYEPVKGSGISDSMDVSDCKGNALDYWDEFYRPEPGNRPFVEIDPDDPFHPKNGTMYSIVYKEGVLTVQWHNVMANCAAPFKYIILERQENNVLYFRYEIDHDGPLTTCDCLFDLSATYDGIEPGEYILKFKNNDNEYPLVLDGDKEQILYARDASESGVKGLSDLEKIVCQSGKDSVEIKCEGEYLLEIYDFSGALMIAQKGRGNSMVQLDGLEHGAYLLKVTEGNRKESLCIMR